MQQLCVVLTSDYSDVHDDNKTSWIAETQEDLQTIKETLASHKIIEIPIPPRAKVKAVQELVQSLLTASDLKEIQSCHIVINSHGAIAQKDLQDAAVLSTVETISNARIPITQISALICHAMSNETKNDAEARLRANLRSTYHMTAAQMERNTKSSTVNILSAKLKKMITAIPQIFNIYGPDKAYFPVADKALVIDVLSGADGVPQQEIQTKVDNFEAATFKDTIKQAINFITSYDRENHTELERKDYDKHTTLLGKVLKKLYSKLASEIPGDNLLSPESQVLYDYLLDHAETAFSPPITSINSQNLNRIYHDWTDKVKVYHPGRLAMFTAYSNLNDEFVSPLNSRDNTPLSSPRFSRTNSPDSIADAEKSSITPINLATNFFKEGPSKPLQEPSEEPSENPPQPSK